MILDENIHTYMGNANFKNEYMHDELRVSICVQEKIVYN
jgi:hypothetical protein